MPCDQQETLTGQMRTLRAAVESLQLAVFLAVRYSWPMRTLFGSQESSQRRRRKWERKWRRLWK